MLSHIEASNICVSLGTTQCIKTSRKPEFVLSSGQKSNIYADLRVLMSHPIHLKKIASYLWSTVCEENIDYVIGVPYGGVPLATHISSMFNVPMLMVRKDVKTYGMKNRIEGVFKPNKQCLLIDDVVTTGKSIDEYEQILKSENLNVVKRVIFSRSDDTLVNSMALINLGRYLNMMHTVPSINFKEFISKKGRLAVSADVKKCREIYNMIDKIGDYISILKLHSDIIEDFDSNSAITLRSYADRYGFLIMEDRKISEIGHIASLQAQRCGAWADLVTVHLFTGSAMLESLRPVVYDRKNHLKGIVPVINMSCGGMFTSEYVSKAVETISNFPDIVSAVVAQESVCNYPLIMPGVNTSKGSDGKGQQWKTPETAFKLGADVIVVGRGITMSDDVEGTTKQLYDTIQSL